MEPAVKILAFIVITVALNIPFGSYRNLTRKFSVAWFLAIHLPIPFIIIMRTVVFHLPLWIIPISLAADIAGQVVGSRLDLFAGKRPETIPYSQKDLGTETDA